MTMSLEKGSPEKGSPEKESPEAAEPAAAPSAAVLRRSRSAVARSAGADRWLAVLLGLALLAVGTLVALLSYGVFGSARAGRPLLDPIVVDALGAQPLLARVVAVAGGVVLALVGLAWAARSLRPEPRPDIAVDAGPDTAVVVSSAAVSDAVAAQATGLAGVGRAKARLVGAESAPALRVSLWLTEDADVAHVLRRLDTDVLATARESLGLADLPTAVRLELHTTAAPPRVA